MLRGNVLFFLTIITYIEKQIMLSVKLANATG
jgi:hypothetical protein